MVLVVIPARLATLVKDIPGSPLAVSSGNACAPKSDTHSDDNTSDNISFLMNCRNERLLNWSIKLYKPVDPASRTRPFRAGLAEFAAGSGPAVSRVLSPYRTRYIGSV
jgi:hypothetical protein